MSARVARENLQAVPTEYKGTRYRSKSEAMFALFLDSIGYSDIFYEPDFPISQWNPDFLACSLVEPSGYSKVKDIMGEKFCKKTSVNWALPRLDMLYIEYKPSMPTKTYINRIAKCCDEFLKCILDDAFYHPDLFSFHICIGGFFGDQSLLRYECGEFVDEGLHWLSSRQRDEARAYRFDLESE